MKRRNFIQNIVLGTGTLLVSPSLFSQENLKRKKRLVILHTNDTHSTIEPFPSKHSKFPNMGGVSKRHTILQKIRSEEEHVLLLDSGDIFQGTPYFNTFNGELEMKLMSLLEYDAATMGNHDFDIGLEGFLNAKQFAIFPFLCANYDFSETILAGHTKAYQIFHKAGIKIGVFGVGVALKGLVSEDKYGKTRYLDPISTANKIASELKSKSCDLVICLSHLGFEYENKSINSDRKLAAETQNIDIILGGHTHTFFDKPLVLKNSKNKDVLINQVGWGGVYLGRIDIDVESGFFQAEKICVD
ncbi:MAG: bifunctional metallophosphatase/5'-nucleotidase [Crocinitomicaceae bacterium]|nr:bifunctional metallophosphatase/5'-nucleotidase [Flavobacteriia bacterium]NDC27717.1 bifunctional metallophosphatase/5'-nucleotidase [Crocinitomicaceae bacterium]